MVTRRARFNQLNPGLWNATMYSNAAATPRAWTATALIHRAAGAALLGTGLIQDPLKARRFQRTLDLAVKKGLSAFLWNKAKTRERFLAAASPLLTGYVPVLPHPGRCLLFPIQVSASPAPSSHSPCQIRHLLYPLGCLGCHPPPPPPKKKKTTVRLL